MYPTLFIGLIFATNITVKSVYTLVSSISFGDTQ